MYQDKKEILREKELQRNIKQYLRYYREKETGEDLSYIDDLPYDELPCDDEEKAELRAYAEVRLPEIEQDMPLFVNYNKKIRAKSWPLNLYDAIYNDYSDDLELNERAGDVLLEAMKKLTPEEEICMRLFYKEKKPWYEICDELDIYITELDEILTLSLRTMRHPKITYWIWQQGIYVGQNGPLPDPVPTDRQKEKILNIAKQKGITKDKVNIRFIAQNLNVNYGIMLALIEYLKEVL